MGERVRLRRRAVIDRIGEAQFRGVGHRRAGAGRQPAAEADIGFRRVTEVAGRIDVVVEALCRLRVEDVAGFGEGGEGVLRDRLFGLGLELQATAIRSPAVSDRLELKVGAKVIFLKNHKPDWINGDLGTVVALEADSIRVRKDITDNVVVLGRKTWERYKYTYDYQTRRVEADVVGCFEQFPLGLGWAVTIHKSQGLSLDALTLDLGGGAFAEGQTYVALSRSRTLDGITLTRGISMTDVRIDPVVISFYRDLDVLK